MLQVLECHMPIKHHERDKFISNESQDLRLIINILMILTSLTSGGKCVERNAAEESSS